MKEGNSILDIDPYDVETYTIEQTMDILKISRPTVDRLLANELIEQKDYLIGGKSRKMLTQDSVNAYKQLYDELEGRSIKQLAKQYNTSSSRIMYLLKLHNIPYYIEETLLLRKTAVLAAEDVERFQLNVSPLLHQSKKNVNSFLHKDFALYQLFHLPDGSSTRLSKLNNQWGFSSIVSFIPLSDALAEGYVPAYEIDRKSKVAKSRFSAAFHFSSLDQRTFQFIDFLYQHVSVKNLQIKHTNSSIIEVSIKSMQLQADIFSPEFVAWLQDCCISGECQLPEDYVVFIEGNHKNVSFAMPSPLHTAAAEYCAEEGIALSHLYEDAIRQYLLSKNKL